MPWPVVIMVDAVQATTRLMMLGNIEQLTDWRTKLDKNTCRAAYI